MLVERPWLARTYFLLGPALRRPHGLVAGSLRCPDSGAVLDLCTGTGLLARRIALRRPDVRVHGLDLDAAMIAEARRLNGGIANCSFSVGDVTELPADDASVDAVTCALGLHEMPAADVPRALAEAWRVLRPGGQLLVLDFSPRPRRLGSRTALRVLRRLEAHLEGFLTLDILAEMKASGVATVSDRMPPGGLYQLLDGTKPGTQPGP
ncbi:MAG: methyltransferase domain-containing protein, partial [Bacillota bacterium]|nr:methyltransferase domain-containing protein [Bacillota bacterium]